MEASQIFERELNSSRFKKANAKDILTHLRVMKKAVQTTPIITPVYLVLKDTHTVHKESIEDGDWYVTLGSCGRLRIGYCRKSHNHFNKYYKHFEEYTLADIPYDIYISSNQLLMK